MKIKISAIILLSISLTQCASLEDVKNKNLESLEKIRLRNERLNKIKEQQEQIKKQQQELIQRENQEKIALMEKMRQEKRFEKGLQGEQAKVPTFWNFELQNKWSKDDNLEIRFYYSDQINQNNYIFLTYLAPTEKVRTRIDINKQCIIDIYRNNKLFKRITPSLRCKYNNKPAACYRTMYLTLGSDGSVYPQTGIFMGMLDKTDSGLDNSNNISKEEIYYQTF